MKQTKAVVILSGGQDSLTCLYWALWNKEFDIIEAITFDYGSNHSVELIGARNVCYEEKVKHTLIDITFLKNIVDSAMLTKGDTSAILPSGLPASFVPNRNAIFITLAHAYAQKIGSQYIIGGMCETDFSGYPDCRFKFLESLTNTLNTGSGVFITMLTPLMYITKAQTFQMAENIGRLNDVIKKSHTCYRGVRIFNEWGYGCGECPACVLRKEGYSNFLKEKNKYSLVN